MTKNINRFLLAFSLLLLSFGSFAKDLKIEEDRVFKSLISEFSSPGTNLDIYKESENYRFDLTLLDIVDKTSLVLKGKDFQEHKEELDKIITKGPMFFYDWFLKLKEIADKDDAFYQKINKKLYIQLYSKSGYALLPEYKFIDIKKLKDLGLLAKIKKYNEIVSGPEGPGILSAMEMINFEDFVTKKLTVSKMGEIPKKKLRKIEKSYFLAYAKILDDQYSRENQQTQSRRTKYPDLKFSYSKKHFIKAKVISESSSTSQLSFKNGIKVFNIIQSVPHKNLLLNYLEKALTNEEITVSRVQGHIVMTPLFIERNWKTIKGILQEFTIKQSVNLVDDEYLLLVRKWIKKNYSSIQDSLVKYNKENKSEMTFTIKKPKRRPRRIEVVKQYEVIEKLFPTRPWMRKDNPDLVDRKGRAKYYDQSFGKKFSRKIGNILKSIIKVENYTSIIIGTATLITTGGNVSMALSLRSLIKESVLTLKHDKEWKEFLLSAPSEVLTAFILGSGFSPGRLYKVLALGAGQGSLQSIFTGQDIKTGALVGAGMNLISYYALPYSISKPMVKGLDAKALRTNRLLEITASSVRSSIQGATVAALTGDDVLKGALKGGAYGAVSAQLTIWFLGTRYHPFKDYTDEDLDEMISAENSFQNDVGRGGSYAINRQMILDANYRVNGLLPKMINASITLPGNVSMSGSGYNRLTTLTHEAHHLMQQHQTGVFGFYLFRYIPTSFLTGYSGHPDENFLRNFLNIYLA